MGAGRTQPSAWCASADSSRRRLDGPLKARARLRLNPEGDSKPGALVMSGIPLDLERRFERRWAARFSGPAKERRLKAQQQHQRVTVPEESKSRRRGTGGFAISNLRPIL